MSGIPGRPHSASHNHVRRYTQYALDISAESTFLLRCWRRFSEFEELHEIASPRVPAPPHATGTGTAQRPQAARRRRLPPGPVAGRSSGRVTAVAACVGTCTFTPPGAAWAITDPGAVFRALAAGGRRGRRDDTHAAAALWQSDVGLDPGACLNRHTTPRCVWRVPPAHCGRPARSAGYHSPLGGMRGAVRRDVQLPPRRIPW